MSFKVEGTRKAHAVCIPCPGQGHINCMLKFAQLLHFKGFHITFVHTQSSYNRILESSGPSSLQGLPDFQFTTISDGLSASDFQFTAIANGEDLSNATLEMRYNLTHDLRRLMEELKEREDVPKATCMVSDMSFIIDIARDFGLPNLSFCSISACGFMGTFAIKELIHRGIVPLKSENDITNGYLDTPINDILGLKNMRLRDFSKFTHTTDPDHVLMNYIKDEAQDLLKTTAMLMHSFDELEGATLEAMSTVFPAVYAIGPLNLMCANIVNDSPMALGSNFWKGDSSCLNWLIGKRPNSVVYVNFGSLAVMSEDQMVEFAWGLVNSNYDFLWVIRPDLVSKGSSVLSEGLLLEVKKRGLLVSWCPQEEVLMHSSIGAFLTHCGWNSMMESISHGVPLICWPFFAEQQTNCRYACNEWRIGVEVSSDARRNEVERKIKEVMGEISGKEIRKNALMYKEDAQEATKIGGTAFFKLDRLIAEVLMSKRS